MIIKGSAKYLFILYTLIIAVGLLALFLKAVSFLTFIFVELIINLGIYVFSGFRLYYYILDDNKIHIKNIYFKWYGEEILYDKISKVKIVNRLDGNRIIKINQKKYISNNLKERDVSEMVEALIKRNIPVERK